MDTFLIKTIFLSAGTNDTESIFWMQILVFVFLGTCWWVYNLVKNKADRFKDKGQDVIDESWSYRPKGHWQFKPLPAAEPSPKLDIDSTGVAVGQGHAVQKPHEQKMRDLDSGMELLELDFLLSIIENTEGSSESDLVMQRLGFSELLRRGKLECISSYALKIYALNQGNLYDTNIQCEAIKELAARSAHHSQHII